jgi:hypothetical protein
VPISRDLEIGGDIGARIASLGGINRGDQQDID